MTALVLPTPELCGVDGCGKLGEFKVGAKLWAMCDPLKLRGPLVLEFGLSFCAAHAEKPVQTAPEFFCEEAKLRLAHMMGAQGRDIPNFSSAEWAFEPVTLIAPAAGTH